MQKSCQYSTKKTSNTRQCSNNDNSVLLSPLPPILKNQSICRQKFAVAKKKNALSYCINNKKSLSQAKTLKQITHKTSQKHGVVNCAFVFSLLPPLPLHSYSFEFLYILLDEISSNSLSRLFYLLSKNQLRINCYAGSVIQKNHPTKAPVDLRLK